MGVRGDMRLYQRAIRQRWLTDEMKADVVAAVKRGLTCGDARAEQTAVRNALMMEEQNQKDEHKVIDVHVVTRNDQYDAIAAELGIDPSVIEHAARQADIASCSTQESTTSSAASNRA